MIRSQPEIIRSQPEILRSQQYIIRSQSDIIKSQPGIIRSLCKKAALDKDVQQPAWEPESEVAKGPMKGHSVRTLFSSWWLGY